MELLLAFLFAFGLAFFGMIASVLFVIAVIHSCVYIVEWIGRR